MPRSGVEARTRLREAALELYRERGYDATTTAQIAERAGVTERTYFRHFSDKREVLFDGEIELRNVLVDTIRAEPVGLTPLEILERAFSASVPLFVKGRRIAELRQPLIVSTPALQERAHAKSAALVEAIAGALAERGIPPLTSTLAAQVGMAAFSRGIAEWDGRSAVTLGTLVSRAMTEVRSLG
jgi:AcrR family transcriptional regulator